MGMKCIPAGDEAVVIEFGDVISEEINQNVHRLAAFVSTEKIAGVREVLPTFRSLMIFYDSKKITCKKLIKKLKRFENFPSETGRESKKIRLVPCCYEAAYGADLDEMAKYLGLGRDEIIRIHTKNDYKIYMLGFLPGFVYLGNLDSRIHMPRLETPRLVIPARSVGIGGAQTGVYPMESPGGWRLIGSTPLDFYNPMREEPILCKAGEYIRFCPILEKEYKAIRKDVEAGRYRPEYQIEM